MTANDCNTRSSDPTHEEFKRVGALKASCSKHELASRLVRLERAVWSALTLMAYDRTAEAGDRLARYIVELDGSLGPGGADE